MRYLRLQLGLPTVAACVTYGCSLVHLRLQVPPELITVVRTMDCLAVPYALHEQVGRGVRGETLTLTLTLTLSVPYALHEQVSKGVSGE